MLAPDGYFRFDEVWSIANEISREICWALRSKETEKNGVKSISIEQHPAERGILQCWLMIQFFEMNQTYLCSQQGVVLRAPPSILNHLTQIEMLPCPIPIEKFNLSDFSAYGSI